MGQSWRVVTFLLVVAYVLQKVRMQPPGDGKGRSGGSEEEKSLLEGGSDSSSGGSEAPKPKRAQSVRTVRVKDDYWKASGPTEPEPERTQSSEEKERLLGEGSSSSDTTGGAKTSSEPTKLESEKSKPEPPKKPVAATTPEERRPLMAEGSSDTTGSTETPSNPGGARLKRLGHMTLNRHEGYEKLGEESGPESPKKETVPPEKRPLLSEESSGTTEATTGGTGKPPKHPETTTKVGLRQKIVGAITGKTEGFERLDKGKSSALSPAEKIVFGVFTGTGGHPITLEDCGAKCKAHFGEMYLPDNNRVPFALPFIVIEKKTNAVRCNCTMNAERIQDLFRPTELNEKYHEFQDNAKKSFCHARVWLYTRDFQSITVDIPYEVESKKLKSPEERAKFSRLQSIQDETHVSPDYFRRKFREEEERKARLEKLEKEKQKKVEGSSKDLSKKGKEVAEISPEEEKEWKALVERNKNKKKDGASEDPSEKGEDVAQISPEEDKIIVGAFPRSKDTGFTDESCKATCQEFFGEVELTLDVLTSFTKPEVLENGNTCSCFVNPRLSIWAEVSRHSLGFLEKFRHFYCHGQIEFDSFDIFLQYEMNAHPNRKLKRPRLDVDAFNKEAAEKRERQNKLKLGRPPQPKKAAEAPQILLGTIQRSSWKGSLSTLTVEKCQNKCNDKFGYILQEPPNAGSSSKGIPPGNPNLPPNVRQKPPQIPSQVPPKNDPPQVSQNLPRIQFTMAKVSADQKACECYFNVDQVLPYLKTRKDVITSYNGWEQTFLHWLSGKPHGYNDGVLHLQSKNIKVVNEDGSEKIVANRWA